MPQAEPPGAVFALVAGEGFPHVSGGHEPLTSSRKWHPRHRGESFEADTGNARSHKHRHGKKWLRGPEWEGKIGTDALWKLAGEHTRDGSWSLSPVVGKTL